MATGTVLVFEEARRYMIDGGFEAADDMKCAILDNGTTPTASFATPALADFTEVGTAGSYTAGGISLGTLTSMCSEVGGVFTFDTTTNPTWAQNASNDVDAWWGLVYHVSSGKAFAFVELGGPVNMATGSLTITWGSNGLFTIT